MSPVITYRPRERLPILSHKIERSPLFKKRFFYTFVFGIFVSAIPMYFHWKNNKQVIDVEAYEESIRILGLNPIHGI